MKKLLILVLIPLYLMSMEPAQKKQKQVKTYAGLRYLFDTVLRAFPVDMKKEILIKLTAQEIDEKKTLLELESLANEFMGLEQEIDPESIAVSPAIELFTAKGKEILKAIDEEFNPVLPRGDDGFFDIINGGVNSNLLEKGFNRRWDPSETPIHSAVMSRHKHKLVKLLAENGADLNRSNGNGNTPLMMVVRKPPFKSMPHDFQIVQLLFDYGAYINCPNDVGATCLYVPIYCGYPEMVEFLLQHHANPNSQDIIKNTPLHAALNMVVKIYKKSDINGLQYYPTDIGLSLNRANFSRDAKLEVIKPYQEIIEYLIKAGADVTKINFEGKTPLEIARKLDDHPIVKILEEATREQIAIKNKNI